MGYPNKGNNSGSGNNNSNRNSGGSKSDGGAKRQPDFDLVALNEAGEIIMEYNEKAGKEVSMKIGAVWLGKGPDSPAFVKFSDGRTAKMFAKKPYVDGGNNSGQSAPAPQRDAPATRPAQQSAPNAPSQQQPARRPSGSAFGGRSK